LEAEMSFVGIKLLQRRQRQRQRPDCDVLCCAVSSSWSQRSDRDYQYTGLVNIALRRVESTTGPFGDRDLPRSTCRAGTLVRSVDETVLVFDTYSNGDNMIGAK
jgi:hypothetical protein